MTAQGSLVANRGRRFKWAIELSGPGGGSRGRSDRGSGQGDSLYPVGYLDKQVPDTSVQETDRILVEKRCWDIALGPLKQIPMNLFIMYMAGNTISIFPTMMA
uniref:ER membrane protein complex subunit 4 n=3 Tax=Primates TaxID=9443 RepID=A0A2I3GLZ7_NOMLE